MRNSALAVMLLSAIAVFASPLLAADPPKTSSKELNAPGAARAEDDGSEAFVGKTHPRDADLLPERKEREELLVELRKLLKAREFEKLNAIYAEIIKSQPRFSNGEAKLPAFYLGVTSWQICPPNQRPLALFNLLREWQAKHPSVLAPLLAEAIVQHDYAWYARGGGYAYTVTPENAKRFEDRLVKARTLLVKAINQQGDDPHLHVVVINVGRSSGTPIPNMKQQVDKALAIDRDYFRAYGALGISLLPRWYGEPGDLEAFLDEAFERTKEDWSEGVYTALAMYTNREGSAIFSRTKIDWERMKAGFRDMRYRYPEAMSFANQFCKYALYANDRKTAGQLFQEIGERFDRDTWGNYARFERLRKATLEGPVVPEGQVLLTPPQPLRILGFRFEPRSGFLYTCLNINQLVSWDPANGLARRELRTGKYIPSLLDFSADGQTMAFWSHPGQVVLMNTSNGEEIASEKMEEQWVKLRLAPDASFVVGILPSPAEICLFDVVDKQVRQFAAGDHGLFSMALSPDGRTLTIGSQFQLLVWDMPDGTKRHTVDGFKLPIYAMAFSQDGKRLAVGHRVASTRLVSIYDTETWDKKNDIKLPGPDIAKICFSPDGKLLAVGNSDGVVKLWQVDGWKPLGESTDHKQRIVSLEFSPDSRYLATKSIPALRIYDVTGPPFDIAVK